VAAQNTRCNEFHNPTESIPFVDKCNKVAYYIDEKASNTIIIEDKNSTLDFISKYKSSPIISKVKIFNGYNFIVKTNLALDVSVKFINCKFRFEPGIQIKSGYGQQPSSKALNSTFDNCKLFACEKMWQGISVVNNSRIIMTNCVVEDAQYAIYATSLSYITLLSNTFNRNYIGIYAVGSKKAGTPQFLKISENHFINTSPLNTPYPGQFPSPTKEFGFAGIKFKNINRGINPNDGGNIFDGLNIGLLAVNSNLKFSKFGNFKNIKSETPLSIHGDDKFGNLDYSLGIGVSAIYGSIEFEGNGFNDSDALTFEDMFANAFKLYGTVTYIQKCKIQWNFGFESSPTNGGAIFSLQNLNAQSISVLYNKIINKSEQEFEGINIIQESGFTYIYGNIITSKIGAGILVTYNLNASIEENLIIQRNIISFEYLVYGIYVVGKNRFTILTNLINDYDGIGQAIVLIACTEGGVYANKINGAITTQQTGYIRTGLYVHDSQDNSFCANEFDNYNTGAKFMYNCDHSTFKSNIFNNHIDALSIGEPLAFNIDARMGVQIRHGNQWQKGGASNLDALCLGKAIYSQFLVRSSATTYPELPNKINPAVDFFKNDVSDINNGNCDYKPFSRDEFSIFEQDLILGKLGGVLSEIKYWEELRFLSARYINGYYTQRKKVLG
jgi:parallel beta-helix repeat protein